MSPAMEAYTRRQAQTEQGQKLDALICDPGRRVPVNQEKVESNAAFATSLAVRHNFGDSPAIWYSRIRMDGSIAPLDRQVYYATVTAYDAAGHNATASAQARAFLTSPTPAALVTDVGVLPVPWSESGIGYVSECSRVAASWKVPGRSSAAP